jgi:hypothetical protein
MAGAEQDDGFLSRWSRRKAQARSAATLPEEQVPEAQVPEAKVPEASVAQPTSQIEAANQTSVLPSPPTEQLEAIPDEPALTLADVAQLTRESDFSRFVAGGVKTDVKNAALKKLFSDPRFNVMDGLDTYIGDYNTPDPLPAGMLVKMAQAKFLGLLKQGAEEMIADCAAPMNQGTIEVEPKSAGTPALPDNSTVDKIATNEDPDLQLQPHDAAGRAAVEPGAGEDGGCEH